MTAGTLKENDLCYCRSQKQFQHCCERFLSRQEIPTTAEQLMRSRYSAYCQQNFNYLYDTLHASERGNSTADDIADTGDRLQWLNLYIVNSTSDYVDMHVAYVEFIAAYQSHNNSSVDYLHERSRFKKENGRWFYVDGSFKDPKQLKLSRNLPCWCGSDKKFKRCHGA